MDWYSWLSRTNLEPGLTYEYGLSFTRNELQKEDLAYFNHEFLVSLGINIAKHRLEILKLARKELGGATNGLSKLLLAFNKTKKLLTRNISKLNFHKNSTHDYDIPPPPLEMSAYRAQWSGALRRLSSSKELQKQERAIVPSKNIMRSGPLDRRVLQEKTMIPNKCLSISGPLDGTMQEKWMAANWSPIRAVPIDGKWRSEKSGFGSRSPSSNYGPWEGRRSLSPMPYYYQANVGVDEGAQSLWSLMFQDLKPT